MDGRYGSQTANQRDLGAQHGLTNQKIRILMVDWLNHVTNPYFLESEYWGDWLGDARSLGASAHVSRLDSCEVGGTYPIFTAFINLFMACKIMFPVNQLASENGYFSAIFGEESHTFLTLQASGSRLYSSKDAFYMSVDLVQWIRNVKPG